MTGSSAQATAHRPEFEAALRLFARASQMMVAQGYLAPILVGGGAVELYTSSGLMTGDLDIVTGRQEEFEAVLAELGFEKPVGRGHTLLGWMHPDLQLGFEVVSSSLYEGMADRDRVHLVDFATDGIAAIVSVEDMIADRLGQYASGTAPDMLEQAKTLFVLYPDADLEYLERRARYETGGDHGIAILRT